MEAPIVKAGVTLSICFRTSLWVDHPIKRMFYFMGVVHSDGGIHWTPDMVPALEAPPNIPRTPIGCSH